MSSSSSSASSSLNPTTRSRTLLFISYRDSRAGASRSRRARIITNYDDAQDDGDDEHERLINADPGHISLDAELPPKWSVPHYLLQLRSPFSVYPLLPSYQYTRTRAVPVKVQVEAIRACSPAERRATRRIHPSLFARATHRLLWKRVPPTHPSSPSACGRVGEVQGSQVVPFISLVHDNRTRQ